MKRSRLKPARWSKRSAIALGVVALLAPLCASTSCATPEDRVLLGAIEGSSSGGPQLGSVDAGTVDAPAAPSSAMCDTTECPAGRATCPGDRYQCAADLMHDKLNCGACGNACLAGNGNMLWDCIDGECKKSCSAPWGDCNGLIDDGCETLLLDDMLNCGACGNTCTSRCDKGVCDCAALGPNARVCNSGCQTEFQQNDSNCGGCDVVCPGGSVKRGWHAYFGCVGGTCGQRKCSEGWGDCNGDLQSDTGNGCETDLRFDDPNNCGACGVVCGANEKCSQGKCSSCKAGEVACQLGDGLVGCFLLTSDPNNCGGCGYACPKAEGPEFFGPGPHAQTACTEGVCGYSCDSGYADCDGELANGCEVNIRLDPEHCGGCNQRCPLAGQACVEGQCVKAPCETEVPR